jgi:hypothetical protein
MHGDVSTNAVTCGWETWAVLEQHDVRSAAWCRPAVCACDMGEEVRERMNMYSLNKLECSVSARGKIFIDSDDTRVSILACEYFPSGRRNIDRQKKSWRDQYR